MKSIHASGRSLSARTTGLRLGTDGVRSEHVGHFCRFRRRDLADLCLLAAPLAVVVLGIAPDREIPADFDRD